MCFKQTFEELKSQMTRKSVTYRRATILQPLFYKRTITILSSIVELQKRKRERERGYVWKEHSRPFCSDGIDIREIRYREAVCSSIELPSESFFCGDEGKTGRR